MLKPGGFLGRLGRAGHPAGGSNKPSDLTLWGDPRSRLNKVWGSSSSRCFSSQVDNLHSSRLGLGHRSGAGSGGDSVSQDSTLHACFLLAGFPSQAGRRGRARFHLGVHQAIFKKVVTFSNPGNSLVSDPHEGILQTTVSWKTCLIKHLGS